ncbi:putative single-stranded DNA binding protein 12k chain [Cutaneotrichosporon oleaginosum]|uniref:Putative single-stranded DNA binding protein 12k chain n=1 Tax=Cutaneotrichosporon oleaginosum TaxID=879819 RepID=A0A0J0XX86_9TREE|nr:putative single-stranded DNA binding protein 12k chain [Cutaneotrichosporon oleaginosum]KLT45676.1 putative single-stranded DNA binding protein 12k chain [Cutaneotrichosporon oleaginosum]TXT04533.1 hypothetical protein COLE_07352 [Cutaneotrichosporon oleaginosum]
MSGRLGPEPRVNARYLSEHRGQTVRLVAKVVNLVGDTATVEASDGGEVAVNLSRDMHLTEGAYFEIIGSVKDDLTVRALTSFALSSPIDMKAVNAVVEFGHSSVGAGVLNTS